MKGIILAGGRATRLYPITKGTCKQLLPVYDKPMIYYPLSVLLLANIKDILIIATPHDIARFQELLNNGSQLGISISYKVQKEPRGIAEAFLIGADFIKDDNVCLVLGDNILYGHNLVELLREASSSKKGATVFGYYVKNPESYGVIEFDRAMKVVSIEEKPRKPKSNWVVAGFYFYDNKVIEIARSLKPSGRGEFEITDINNAYLRKKALNVKLLGRGYAWLDTGTPDSLIDASMFIKTIEERQGLKIGCIEEIAYRLGYISSKDFRRLISSVNSGYRQYLEKIFNEK